MESNLDRQLKYKSQSKEKLSGDLEKSKEANASLPKIARNRSPLRLKDLTPDLRSSKRFRSNLRDSALQNDRRSKLPSVNSKDRLKKFRQIHEEVPVSLHKPNLQLSKNSTIDLLSKFRLRHIYPKQQ